MTWQKCFHRSRLSAPSVWIVAAVFNQKSVSAPVRIARCIRIGWGIIRTERVSVVSFPKLNRKKNKDAAIYSVTAWSKQWHYKWRLNERKGSDIINVLVACEESQEVCKAFRARGHNAFSCDIQECSGGHPEWHICDDAFYMIYHSLLDEIAGAFWTQDGVAHDVPPRWDLIIAHPPCTYLSNAGARWLYAGGKINSERFMKGQEGRAFFMSMLDAPCDRICVENPIPSRIFTLPKPTQIIQPYEYGEPWSKKTCLWLKGLPPLIPTEIVEEHKPYCSSGSYSKTHDTKYKGISRKGGAAKIRSKTFPGVARAMAEQWG